MADKRPTITIKSQHITPEFRALINEAARAEGMTQADWIVQNLSHSAQQSIGKQAAASPDTRLDEMAAKLEALEAKLDALMTGFPRSTEGSEKRYFMQPVDLLSAPEREAIRNEMTAEFVALGVEVEPYQPGQILINGKFVVSLLKPIWRVKGKGKRYSYTSPRQFVERYVRRAA